MTEPRPEHDLDHYRSELDACRREIERLRALVLARVDTLNPTPEDALVVRLSRQMDPELCSGIAGELHRLFPERKVLIVDSTVELTIEAIADLLREPQRLNEPDEGTTGEG